MDFNSVYANILAALLHRSLYSLYVYPEIPVILIPAAWMIFAYFVGSIPSAWLLAKWITNRDLRVLGSGNVGVMNTAISVARWAGLIALLAEIGKGIIVILVPRLFGEGELVLCLSIVGVVMGTHWPIWLRFKGGRGNTAGFTGLFLVSYPAPVITLALWSLARMLLKTSFSATRFTILSLPVILWLSTRSWSLALTGITLASIYLHAQKSESDDHLLLKEHFPSFWKFLLSPPRRK